MTVLSDLLLASAALAAAVYCFVLSRKLAALSALDGGLGSAIAVLSAQVDSLSKSLATARAGAANSSATLGEQTQRAEAIARKLELLVAAMHDLDGPPDGQPPSRWPPQTDPQAPAARSRVLRRRSSATGDA